MDVKMCLEALREICLEREGCSDCPVYAGKSVCTGAPCEWDDGQIRAASALIEGRLDCAPPDDAVNHPSHYADKQIEVIDYIRDTLTMDGFVDYCIGNVIKYVSRWRRKGGVEDLRKAQVYLKWAIESKEQYVTCEF